MKTIVINTSKEAAETKLDVLFKTPCDRNSLLWFETELADIHGMPPVIRQALIDDVDVVDRVYNLIVLVDLCCLPHGNDSNYVNIYKPLLARYIGMKLVYPLHSEQGLTPKATSVYFADSSTAGAWYDYAEFKDINAVEQRKREEREALEAERVMAETDTDGEGGLVDTFDAADKNVKKEKSSDQNDKMINKIIMDIFGWSEDMTKDDVYWNIPLTVDKQKYLDYTSVFSLETAAISCRPEGYPVINNALDVIKKVIANGEKKGEQRFFVSRLPDSAPIISSPDGEPTIYEINCLTYKFARDNEQAVIEGFFNLLANIFNCVQAKRLTREFETYCVDNIKEMLLCALKKYKHFSIEENITVKFEPVAKIYELKNSIFSARKKNASSSANTEPKDPYEVADEIMSKTVSSAMRESSRLRGVDREFQALVESIFNNYDVELIREQNSNIVKECLTGLWAWRDKQTGEDFKRTVDAVLNKPGIKDDSENTKENVRETVSFIDEEYEREYARLINEVTETEHSLSSNKNILLETKDLVLKYGDLMRKGKVYLISSVGAFISVATAVLPYLYVEYYAGTNPFTFASMGPLIVAGALSLYGTAASIYATKIASKKRKLRDELEELKKKSEDDRRESIAALYKYYSQTVIDAENHCLLWREISRRDRENSKKGIKRNNHIKQLEFLAGEVQRFMTMLKFDFANDACAVTDDDRKRYENEGLCLNAEESFHSEDNQKIYSVLSEKITADNNGEKGGI